MSEAEERRLAAVEQMTVNLWDRLERIEARVNELCQAAFYDTHGGIATLERVKRLEARLGMEP